MAEAAATAKDKTPSSHTPSLAGSVIEAKDGMGGSNFIRIQNMSATGTFAQTLQFRLLDEGFKHPFSGSSMMLFLSLSLFPLPTNTLPI